MSMIAVKYDCKACGKLDQEVDVPIRQAHVDIVDWMKQVVMPRVSWHHEHISPDCPSESCDLKIPAPAGTQHLGGPVTH